MSRKKKIILSSLLFVLCLVLNMITIYCARKSITSNNVSSRSYYNSMISREEMLPERKEDQGNHESSNSNQEVEKNVVRSFQCVCHEYLIRSQSPPFRSAT